MVEAFDLRVHIPCSQTATACANPYYPHLLTLSPIPPGAPATPFMTRLSDVSVPVLSKQQTSIFPASGIRKGSVQNIMDCVRAVRELMTARLSSIGSSGGMTLVRIMMQCSTSLNGLRVSSARPYDDVDNGQREREWEGKGSKTPRVWCVCVSSAQSSIKSLILPTRPNIKKYIDALSQHSCEGTLTLTTSLVPRKHVLTSIAGGERGGGGGTITAAVSHGPMLQPQLHTSSDSQSHINMLHAKHIQLSEHILPCPPPLIGLIFAKKDM